MNPAMELRNILVESGILVAMAAAGIGAYRFFMKVVQSIMLMPGQVDRCAIALENSVGAMEKHNALSTLVLDLRNLVVATRDDLTRAKAEQEHFRREMRILSRRLEGGSIYAQNSH